MNSSEVIKGLYRTSEEDFVLLEVALTAFMVDVRKEFDADVLERCVLADGSWEIPVEERIVVMRRAKELGASSAAFLTDYFVCTFGSGAGTCGGSAYVEGHSSA